METTFHNPITNYSARVKIIRVINFTHALVCDLLDGEEFYTELENLEDY